MLTRPGAAALLLTAGVAAGCSSPDGGWPAPPGHAPEVPESSVLVGAAVTPDLPVSGPQRQAFDEFDSTVAAETDIAHQFRTWDVPLVPEGLTEIADSGRYPMLSWNAADIAGIAAGRHDDHIRAEAEALAATEVPTLLRFRWEMDRPNLRATVVSPDLYVRAWRRAHTIFEEVGTPAVSWVWCPTAAGFTPGGDAAAFYPGDDVVDWLCADTYPDRDLRPLADLLGPFLQWAEGRPLPVMIGEFGVPRTADDATRARWLAEAGSWLDDQPQVRAVVYFDLDVDPDAPVLQYGLDPGTAAAAAFGELTADLEETDAHPS